MNAPTIGTQLRQWRHHRRLSQLDCALEAEISQRHLSFIESGRASPSREMVLHLSERLDIPLRERNVLLLAAGFAPEFQERSLDDPRLAPARRAVDLVLKGHEPFPALAVDRHFNLVAANAAAAPFMTLAADPALTEPPANVMRLSLHPRGLAPHIANLSEWRRHLLDRLRRQAQITGDRTLGRLLQKLSAYPEPPAPPIAGTSDDLGGVAVPLELIVGGRRLSFLSTMSVFGTAADITLSELSLECLFPADEQTAQVLTAGL
jgi:transcriptional regulator with XRE-family HTH domain